MMPFVDSTAPIPASPTLTPAFSLRIRLRTLTPHPLQTLPPLQLHLPAIILSSSPVVPTRIMTSLTLRALSPSMIYLIRLLTFPILRMFLMVIPWTSPPPLAQGWRSNMKSSLNRALEREPSIRTCSPQPVSAKSPFALPKMGMILTMLPHPSTRSLPLLSVPSRSLPPIPSGLSPSPIQISVG